MNTVQHFPTVMRVSNILMQQNVTKYTDGGKKFLNLNFILTCGGKIIIHTSRTPDKIEKYILRLRFAKI